jgi:hypothetical protein
MNALAVPPEKFHVKLSTQNELFFIFLVISLLCLIKPVAGHFKNLCLIFLGIIKKI